VGTGRVNLGIFLANGPAPDNIPMAFAGPLMSYYETVTNDFLRYNDKEWSGILKDLKRPDWTSIYLVNKSGNYQEKGVELPFETIIMPGTYTQKILTGEPFVYPNPVSTLLNIRNFSPDALIYIYDIEGRNILTDNNRLGIINVNTLEKGIYILKIIEKVQQK